MNPKTKPETWIGRKYGCYTIVGVSDMVGRNRYFSCECECGRKHEVPKSVLVQHPPRHCQMCKPILPTPVCACGAVICRRGGKCRSCRTAAAIGVPHKYPISIGIIAAMHDISRQAVSLYIKKHGWAAAVTFYGLKEVA